MIYYQTDTRNHVKVFVTTDVFKDGSVKVNINAADADFHVGNVWITARPTSPELQIALEDAVEAIRHYFPNARLNLDLLYVPYGRQDRRCNEGEALQLKRFGGMINRLGLEQVQVYDPHSEVTQNVIDRCAVVTQYELFGNLYDFSNWVIVAPDLGAMKKVEEFARRVGAKGTVSCYKERNLSTNEIIREEILGGEQYEGSNFFVLDDIIDGGRTFVGVHGLLQRLKPRSVVLAATHGIFSYGQEVVTNLYDQVYTTNSFHRDLEGNKLTVINLD